MKNDLLTIGGFTIHGYGLMIGIGIIAAYWAADYRSKRYHLDPDHLFWILIWGVGCGLLGLGVTLEVLGDVIMLPGEALVRAISQKSHVPFHRVKVLFDSTLTLIAAVAALLAFGRLNGVKEGTLVAALAVGPLVNVYTRCLGPSLRRWLDAPAV